jgi:hypothetical protein
VLICAAMFLLHQTAVPMRKYISYDHPSWSSVAERFSWGMPYADKVSKIFTKVKRVKDFSRINL